MPEEEFAKEVEAKREATRTRTVEADAKAGVPARVITPVSLSFRRWMKLFRSGMDIHIGRVPCDGWSRKQRDEACGLVNELTDKLVAMISVVKDNSDDAAAVPHPAASEGPPDLTTPAGVRAAKQAREKRTTDLKARRALRRP